MQQGETAYKVVKGRPKRVRTVRIKRIIFVYIFNLLALNCFGLFLHTCCFLVVYAESTTP